MNPKPVMHIRLAILQKQMDEKIRYVEKHCVLNKSMHCKKKWKEISALHKMTIKLSKEIKE